jgi:hypothetical protein
MPRLRPIPERPAPEKINERRKALWLSLNEFITQNGGWIVSVPSVTPIRFECRVDNLELLVELRKLGYAVHHAGTAERLLPIVETMHEHGRRKEIRRE